MYSYGVRPRSVLSRLARLQAIRKITGHKEGVELSLQLVGHGVVIPLHGGVFQRPAHPFD